MFATLYLPNFYLQAAMRYQPELADQPVALLDDLAAKAIIIQLNQPAEDAGVQSGMTPTQGWARQLSLIIKTRVRPQEKLLGELLLQFAYSLAPYIEDTAPGVCTVQFTDPKNAERDVGRMVEQLRKASLIVQAGISHTPDASFIAAHLARPVLKIDDPKDFFAPLTIETLAFS